MFNQCTIIGHMGADVETRTFGNGGKVANIRLAVTDKWKDKNSGEQREKTEWVPVEIYSEGLVRVAEQYLKKGSKVLVQGKYTTRKYQAQDGSDRYSTAVVLQGFDSKLVMLGGGERNNDGNRGGGSANNDPGHQAPPDDLPFQEVNNV
jgi:single-strand DNA-binding protein